MTNGHETRDRFSSQDKVAQKLKQRAISCSNLDTDSITMNSIQFHSSLLPPLLSNPIHKPQWKARKLAWSSSREPTRIVEHSKKLTTRTRAIAESLILGVASQARPRDVSVLLQTGALLLGAYGIANFVFPAFISNYYEFDKVSEDTKPNDPANPSDDTANPSDDEADPSDEE